MTAFDELLDKYRQLHALRLAREAGEPGIPDRMRELAARFPGALRELDGLSREAIVSRIELLERGERPAWAEGLVAFHGWMRVALRIKRSFGRESATEEVLDWLRLAHRERPGEPELRELDGLTVDQILRPPGGRLSKWLLRRIAEERGLTPDELGRELFEGRST